jgi:glutamate 5-kinase
VIADLARDIVDLRYRGYEIVMVVSGAVAAGYEPLGMSKLPGAVVERQAAASVGQHRLLTMFAEGFAEHCIHVAQLLMSADDIENRRRFLSARHTLLELLARGVVPIINENDALSDDEDKVGDNDHLAALVTNVVSAELLVVLSTVQGLCTDRGTGPVIPEVEVGSDVEHHICDGLSSTGVGGMKAKVSAARLAAFWGVPTVIMAGRTPGLVARLLNGEQIGTLFVPRGQRIKQRKRWIAFRNRSTGAVIVDAGAREAVVARGASLLPSGVTGVEGKFPMGARVDIRDENGETFAVGLVSYSSDEIFRLRGRKVSEIKTVLGHEYVREIIHRDDLVLTREMLPEGSGPVLRSEGDKP